MKILVCTENKAKIQAVKEVFEKVFAEIEIIGESFSSGISEQPLSEEEGILGAINRVKNGREKHPEVDYCVGLEGYVDSNKFGMFLAGAVAVQDKKGIIGIGISGKMLLPNFIQKEINNGKELGPVITELMNDKEGRIRQYDGTNGILSKGIYNRVDEFKDATKCALARFVSHELFNR